MRSHGLTLIELLLVVFILSTVALSVATITDQADSQARFEDTRTRLDLIRKAVVGDPNLTTINGQPVAVGFASDTGHLPGSLQALVEGDSAPGAGDALMLVDPVFDPVPDGDAYNNGPTIGAGAEIALNLASEKLLKGLRKTYLSTSPGSTQFHDGWGNVGDAANYGWVFDDDPDADPDTQDMSVTSVGSDLVVGGVGAYEQDLTLTISESQWMVDLSQALTVSVENVGDGTGAALTTHVHAAVLVYDGDSPSGSWRRINTDTDGSVDDGATDSLTVPAVQVPVGEHLIVLIDDDDTTPGNGTTETPYTEGSQRFVQRITIRADAYPLQHVLFRVQGP